MENKLKEKRLEAGMTQEELAQAIGSSKSYVCQLENENRDIRKIRQDTMQRICVALDCEAKDLIVSAELEYTTDGKLIVDNLWYDQALSHNCVVEISGEYFIAPSFVEYDTTKKPLGELLRPMTKKISVSAKELPQCNYLMLGCVPRGGFKVEVGRAITKDELDKLINEYKLGADDISAEFIDAKGALYGDAAKINFAAVQIRVSSSEAIAVETKLRNMGIEAANIAPERVNIRVK